MVAQVSRTQTYQGKVKTIKPLSDNPHISHMIFSDTVTSGNGLQCDTYEGLGKVRCRIASLLFEYLQFNGLSTHYLGKISHNTLLIKHVFPLPFEVVVRFVARGGLLKRESLKYSPGEKLITPKTEVYLKDDSGGDPLTLLSRHYSSNVPCLELLNASNGQPLGGSIDVSFVHFSEIFGEDFSLDESIRIFLQIQEAALMVAQLLKGFLLPYQLEDLKLEFGMVMVDGLWEVILIDAITPDEWRLLYQSENFDKDSYRRQGEKGLPLLLRRYDMVGNFLKQKTRPILTIPKKITF